MTILLFYLCSQYWQATNNLNGETTEMNTWFTRV